MQNRYELPEVIQIGQAQSLILGAKEFGWFDAATGDENSHYNMMTDIDE